MSAESPRTGIGEQDRTLSDLLESYRHRQSDPAIPEDRKRRAAERMKPVWAKLAKLQDPDGFINHISEFVQREYNRRHEYEDLDGERRKKPLCRCDRSKHVCEVKEGEVPSKIRTQDLKYISKPDSRTLAREYIQEHSGDVVIREAMEVYRNLRAEIYSEVSDILAMMMGAKTVSTEREDEDGAHGGEGGTDDPQPPTDTGGAHASTASADGGVSVDPEELVDQLLASALDRHGTEQVAADATEGALTLASVMEAFQNGDVDTSDLQAVANGEKSVTDLDLDVDTDAPEVEPEGEDGEDTEGTILEMDTSTLDTDE